ncbi:MAG: NADH-quinone oxidoreductase subunit NuoK [Bacteroidota bacterium]
MENIITALRTISIDSYIWLCSIMFVIGVAGVLIRRNAIVVFMSIEIMLNSVNLLLAAFAVYHNDTSGQLLVFFIMTVAAAEVAVGLALLVMIFRNAHTIDINFLSKLKG